MRDITEHPDEGIEIVDDNEALKLLVALGLHDQFSKRGLHDGEWAEFMLFNHHPSHWLFAIRYTGFPNAIDNGYAISCFPKSRVIFDEFKALVQAKAKALDLNLAVVLRDEPYVPPQN